MNEDKKVYTPPPPALLVGGEASEIERLTAERDELQKALDSAEIDAGITSNGNLWRFWSWKSRELAVKYRHLAAERDRLRKALEPFALISREGLVADDVYTTVTTVSDYFHAASRVLASTEGSEG